MRHVLISGCHSRFNIRYKYDNVGAFYGKLSLFSHLGQYNVAAFGFDASCINQHKLPIQPLTFGVYSVAGDSGGIVHYAHAFSYKLVEKRGLSYVGSSYYGY